MKGSLTKKEQDLISLLGECFTKFSELEDFHPNDLREFITHIHILQRQVMARLARREHPEMFSGESTS